MGDHVVSATKRLQLLKLRQFEVSKSLLTWAHSPRRDRSVLQPSGELCQLRVGKGALGRLSRHLFWDQSLFCFKLFLVGSRALLGELCEGPVEFYKILKLS